MSYLVSLLVLSKWRDTEYGIAGMQQADTGKAVFSRCW
jgi:hypothetical protein